MIVDNVVAFDEVPSTLSYYKGAEGPPIISCFLVKIASRCNLNCDYCYVYQHADQNWKKLPPILSAENVELLANRIAEYFQEFQIPKAAVVFHGGEPLLAGAKKIVEAAEIIRAKVPETTDIDFCLQTNGVLLNEKNLSLLVQYDISISLSLDGPKAINDLHRLKHNGKSSFEKVSQALNRLKEHPKHFSGVISVIDPLTDPEMVLEYFSKTDVPSLDFLLPDANYEAPPKYRDQNPAIYKDWLLKAFDLWFEKYSHMKVRFFDMLLNSLVGLPSETDSFGFGDVSLLSIETDGSYHDLDVLKITNEQATTLQLNLKNSSVLEAASSPKIAEHRRLTRKEGLSSTCQQCEVVDVCGGGAIPHRYSKTGFKNPTIYCDEMFTLIQHAKNKLKDQLEKEKLNSRAQTLVFAIDFNQAKTSVSITQELLEDYREQNLKDFLIFLDGIQDSKYNSVISDIKNADQERLKLVCSFASVKFWLQIMQNPEQSQFYMMNKGKHLEADLSYLHQISHLVMNTSYNHYQRSDYWLRAPFDHVIFESATVFKEAEQLIEQAFNLIKAYDQDLYNEIYLICTDFQFVRDLDRASRLIISFSDNVLLGCIYISLYQGDQWISVEQLADSIIHEYRHQKLYLLEKFYTIVVKNDLMVYSPWPKALRTPQSLFHAVFVFHELLQFWKWVAKTYANEHQKALNEIASISDKMQQGVNTLKTCSLTELGSNFIRIFEKSLYEN